jgi:hypothetical protein
MICVRIYLHITVLKEHFIMMMSDYFEMIQRKLNINKAIFNYGILIWL